jgi:PTS system nitrogen regulatory IIA component
MDLCDLLAPDGIMASMNATSKKHALQELSNIAAERTGLDAREIFNTLLQRERLGSTGLGRGIAIPHVKLTGLKRIFCLFARLDQPIDYESHDNEPVDLIFLLLAPETAGADHLKALARVARLLREGNVVTKLRQSRDADAIYAVLAMPSSEAA